MAEMKCFYNQLGLAFLLTAGLVLSGCGQRETRVEHGIREQILHYGNGTEPQDLDPQVVTGVPEHRILSALFEGLVSAHPKTLEPEPGVAERWDISDDGRVYTFHLHENAKWSNGEPITARDFVRSYQRMLSPNLASAYDYMLFYVVNAEEFNKGQVTDFSQVGFKALDDRTLEITLKNPTVYFLGMLNHYSWFPVHIPTIEKFGQFDQRGTAWTRPGNLVSNGPFTLDQWQVNRILTVKKNPHYWDAGRVRLQEIHFYPIESADTEERAFRSGQLHVTNNGQLPLSKIPGYRENFPELLRLEPWLGTYFYRFNTTRKPLNDPRVRRALALAIDRESLVRNVILGDETPAYNLTPPNTAGYTARARLEGDLEEARQLLADAGFPNGENFPSIEILYNTHDNHRVIAEAVQQMWRQNLGINIRLTNQEWKVYLDSMYRLDYDIARAGWIADYVDPNSFLNMWLTGGGNNNTGFSNPEYDRLIAESERTGDPAERLEILQQAEAIFMEELPIIPVYFYTSKYLLHPSVKGWHANYLDNHPYKYVYLEAPNTH
jgi:oligopeptide transport system substrate-binding protein